MTDWTDARQRVERLAAMSDYKSGGPEAKHYPQDQADHAADADALRSLLAQVDQAEQIERRDGIWRDNLQKDIARLRQRADKAEADAAALVSRLGEVPVSREDREQALRECVKAMQLRRMAEFGAPAFLADADKCMAEARRLLKLDPTPTEDK